MYSEKQADSISEPGAVKQVSWEALQSSAAELPTVPGKRDKLAIKLVSTATKLRPLFELLEKIQPHLENDSVFSSRREKISTQLAIVRAQLKLEQPKHRAVAEAFHMLGEFVREEAREVTKDEVKESAKRFVLATVKNAPSLIAAARQAGVLH
ncbi:hypothetical protein [Hymenobacter fodinae]|uniref:Uncharacterized protein n=1 Tax=Hymenobacter fodinae TaxID=2510796 RepID=A0A4Z0P6A5_9BACT|nr:hypothetical protein [Hymenobacter fodinae]TGE07821.1 hypothetical protein EU556_08700 [Hymenobacter fodinae]